MILRNSDLQSVSDLDSIRNSCDVSFKSSHIYFDYLTVLDLSKKGGAIPPPTTHRKGGFWLLSAFFLLQGADNKGGFWLISAFFLLQGAGD